MDTLSPTLASDDNGPDAPPLQGPPWFYTRQIDDQPALLEESYRLRFQVYCHERGFLNPNDYPDGLEIDDYDAHSLHFGVFNLSHKLAGTARLIRKSERGLPLYEHCQVYAEDRERLDGVPSLVEVSRLAISRDYRRRAHDGSYGLAGAPDFAKQSRQTLATVDRRTPGLPPVMYLYKAMYHANKQYGFSHWLAATERSLNRLLTRLRFPFKPIGPAVDYYGPVTPYMLDLDYCDSVLARQCPILLKQFMDGLPEAEQAMILAKIRDHEDRARRCHLSG